MSRRRHISAASLVVALLVGPALAQETKPPAPEPKPAPKEPSKEGGRIRMGNAPAAEPDAPAPAPKEGAKKSDPELWMDELALWPAAEGRQASIRLSGVPTLAWPLLERAMLEPGKDWRLVAGAAATLGKIRDLRGIDLVRAKLEDRKMYQHSGDLVDALVRIDPVGAKPRLLALLVHPASAVVAEVERALEPKVAPDDAPALRDVYDAGGPAARASALRLLTKADRAGARADLVKALRDKEPDVAIAAALSLAADDDPGALDALRKAMTTPLDRQFAYAAIGMAHRAERRSEREVDDATVRLLLGGRGLKSLDRGSQAASAILLADLGYFHDVPLLDEAFDRQVVPLLIDSFVNREFWADTKVVQPLAMRRLRRITGRLDLARADEWMSWWEQEGPTFKARRVLASVAPESASELVLTVEGPDAPGGETTILTAAASAVGPQRQGELSLLLDAEEAKALAAAVNESGVLTGPAAGDSAASGAHVVVVGARVGRRDRRTVLRVGTGDTAGEKLLALVADLRARLAWQRYRTGASAEDAVAFVTATRGAFGPERSSSEKSRALASLVVRSIDDRRGEAWNVRALTELAEMPDLGKSLEPEDTDRLLAILGGRTSMDPTAEAVLRVLARAGKPEATPHLIDFVLTRGGMESRTLLTRILAGAPRAQYLAALDDTRADVRLAAFAATDASSADDDVAARLLRAVDDRDRGVASEAVRALGRLRLEKARPLIDRLAETQSELRPAAVEALGLLGGRESLPTIMTAYASDDPGLRIAAIQALAASREPEGLSAIVFAMGGDPSALVREVASRAILDLGGERAASELRRLAVDPGQPAGPRARALAGYAQLAGRAALGDLGKLVDDPAPEVADEAALGLARWRDPVAVPRLIAMLQASRAVQRARHGLESISLESFGQKDPAMLADLYSGWWELSKERGPRRWLLDALTLANSAEDAALRAWAEGDAGRGVVPSMIAALRSDRWYVRRAADLTLRELLQRKVGDQDPWTTPGDVARMADTWEKVWAEVLTR